MQTHHDTPAWHALDGASCLQQLDSQCNGLTAEQVLQRAAHYTSDLSRATVYNTLKLFTARGLLRELAIEPGKTMFDSNPEPHHHLYNSATGELTDIPVNSLTLSGQPTLPDGLELEQIEVIVRVRPREHATPSPIAAE